MPKLFIAICAAALIGAGCTSMTPEQEKKFCEPYGLMTITEVPAFCIKHFQK